jgi:23S rRNA (uracil1939-C5)-methyltransferase
LAIRAGAETGDFLIQPTLKNPEIPVPTGQKHYRDSVGDRSFRVASPSFFQVNNPQTQQLVQLVRTALDLRGDEVLLDAYTGVGTFAILLAPYVARVLAVEESSAAVADARENAAGRSNVDFLLGKTEEVLQLLEERPDIVVLDPPRAGCQLGTLASLLRLAPPRIVYVSCDPETLARDLKILCDGSYQDGSYQLESVLPLDMFPQTHHVECLTVLTHSSTRKTTAPPLILASASPRRRELLEGLGWDFQVLPSNVPEPQLPGESGQEMVRRLSREKAQAVAARLREGYVIAADSTVILNGRVLGKPEDTAEARQMLRDLRGMPHQVATGVTVIEVASGRLITDCLTSEMRMRDYTDAEMEVSIDSGLPLDKAGAYAVQDREFRPATMTAGCYSNVVGLPLCRLFEMLEEVGYPVPAYQAGTAPEQCLIPCPLLRRNV